MDHRRSSGVTVRPISGPALSPPIVADKMMLNDERFRNGRQQRAVWFGLTSLAVIAVVVLNSDRNIASLDTMDTHNIEAVMAEGPVGRMSPMQPKPIEWISVLGERNSGTRWLYDHIGECFNHTLGVKRYLTRYKHWFQYRNASKYPHDTLVLAQFRNPYDWLEAMRNVPHHAPGHLYMKWEEFIVKEWSIPRVGLDLNMTDDDICQEDFQYNQVISCNEEPLPKETYGEKIRYSEHQPFYELRQDGSGLPFKNIMEMRAAKIRNFLEVRDYPGIADVWSIQYEYLLTKGTDHLLTKIEEWTGVKRQCEAFPAQNRRKRPLSRTFAKYVNMNLDWTAEGLIGYVQEEIA